MFVKEEKRGRDACYTFAPVYFAQPETGRSVEIQQCDARGRIAVTPDEVHYQRSRACWSIPSSASGNNAGEIERVNLPR